MATDMIMRQLSRKAMAELAATLASNRTPNILKAAQQHLEARCADEAGWAGAGHCTIERHGYTERVPWVWLTVGLALNGMIDLGAHVEGDGDVDAVNGAGN